MKILITGGAGFIGSTVCSALQDAGHVPIVLDDLSTGAAAYLRDRVGYVGDVADRTVLDRIFTEHPDIAVAVHCAASIVVPESTQVPLAYYRNNVARTVDFVEFAAARGCTRVLFSSSASIYAPGADFTVDETSLIDPQSPYAATKAMVERILSDAAAAGLISALSLRYFNPVGADPQLRTGLQLARPSHALGKLIEAYEEGTPFRITGVDWPTRDGSAIRDYIHVWDLARAHVHAVEHLAALPDRGAQDVLNLGTGRGTTVRELVAAFEEATGAPLPTVDAPPRPGDVVGSYTRADKADRVLGWRAELSLVQAIRDALAWAARRESALAGVGAAPGA